MGCLQFQATMNKVIVISVFKLFCGPRNTRTHFNTTFKGHLKNEITNKNHQKCGTKDCEKDTYLQNEN